MIMYDEHGGYYDHVPPPYIRTGPSAKSAPSGFDFSILGPRVPTVFVSPRIERRQPPVRPQSSSQYFTHESLVLTLAKVKTLVSFVSTVADEVPPACRFGAWMPRSWSGNTILLT